MSEPRLIAFDARERELMRRILTYVEWQADVRYRSSGDPTEKLALGWLGVEAVRLCDKFADDADDPEDE